MPNAEAPGNSGLVCSIATRHDASGSLCTGIIDAASTSDSRNMLIGPGGRAADSLSTAKWDGARLTIVTRQEMDGQVTESTEVWTVEGGTLTVETTSARGTQKRVYRK